MKFATREYSFKSTITGNLGERATLTADYRVELRRNDIEDWTYIIVRPDFGPQRTIRVRDVDITWKSLFYAYKWCHRHAMAHLLDWTEADLLDAGRGGCALLSGAIVIPDIDLSTIGKVHNNA